jgi:hypothetical protein
MTKLLAKSKNSIVWPQRITRDTKLHVITDLNMQDNIPCQMGKKRNRTKLGMHKEVT